MANPKRGEVEIDAPNGTRYTLKLTTNAVCEVQKRTGKNLRELFLAAVVGDNLLTREFVWLLLQPYHATEIDSLDKAGNFIDLWPLFDKDSDLAVKITELLDLNQPPERETKADGGDANPPSAQAGTSAASSSLTLVESA